MPEPARAESARAESAPSTLERRRNGRQLGAIAVLAVAGAGLTALAANLTWWSAEYLDPLPGALDVTASGAGCVPELVPLALVGLAGLGAALAARGGLRRAVGAVLVLSGAVLTVRSVMALVAVRAVLTDGLIRPAEPVGSAQVHPIGPAMAVAGGLLLVTAGTLILLGRGARRRMGARYDGPARRTTSRSPDPAAAPASEQADWWKALDAGDDPTDPLEDDSGNSAQGGSPTVSEDTSKGGYHDPNASGSQ